MVCGITFPLLACAAIDVHERVHTISIRRSQRGFILHDHALEGHQTFARIIMIIAIFNISSSMVLSLTCCLTSMRHTPSHFPRTKVADEHEPRIKIRNKLAEPLVTNPKTSLNSND